MAAAVTVAPVTVAAFAGSAGLTGAAGATGFAGSTGLAGATGAAGFAGSKALNSTVPRILAENYVRSRG